MKVKYQFLGGADIVGRMGLTMEGPKKTILIEYGMSPSKPPEYPMQAPHVDHVFLTHAHLDHCGMVPVVCGRQNCELFTTPVTAEVGELLMNDSLKIAKAENYPQPYTANDVDRTMRNVVPLTFGDTIEIGRTDVTLYSAGHIPGASMFLFEGDTTTLYSGDIHTADQRLVSGAKPVDCETLFIEGTYGGRNHPPRSETEVRFLNKVREVVERGGKCIIPCFAIGRTQEIMLLLKDLKYEMWVDGMGRSVTRMFLDYPEYLRDPKKLKAAKRNFNTVKNSNMRRNASRGQVIVTTGGMLDGGPVLGYVNSVKNDPKSAILIVGYQAEDTNGRMLLEQGSMVIDGESYKIECEVQRYDFSAHADHSEIVDFIQKCDPKNVIFMHSEVRELFLPDLQDYNVILPELGQEFEMEV
ncbi:MAG: MBL fold metallo-hydrolase [Candidatus Methanomethylophilaceae archaeon]|jgi:putative mRNA 3-end processing factor|nr:MBL fold metallo-hydrolase [Candidatus Methanomethylophilaceae archaeon]MDD3986902.1 MBL fold metallo-hydrolase [Candidatus Methanomethylophilaceae archaeon]MDD4708977.1 MBL fold metallo-hydrolase [Candidatus Methanomethylophilaceae archaeon]MDY0252120.1 MBL fold metallo-hydrolase [Candidatus Methanomethylophilaceae archaeon]NCA73647.1 MBL fold metallo-hydrolase [Gammaproteobacteria bacterium]